MKLHVFRKRSDCAVMAGLIVLFAYFAFFCTKQELSDSFQYLNQFVTREPVYALLLQGFTGIFREDYLFFLCLFQNILAVVAIYWTYKRITDLFRLPGLFELGTVGLLIVPHLITPLLSKSGMIITNSVLTEGVAFSLYYIWTAMLLTLLTNGYSKHMPGAICISGLLSVLLAMIRGQFLLCMVIWLLVSIWVLFLQKKYRAVLWVCCGFVILFAGKSILTKTYNYKESGLYVNTVSGKPMMLANVLYLSEPEDGNDIADADMRQAYENMVAEVEKQQLNIRYAKGNVIDRAQFHEYGHETINFDIIDPEIEAVIEKKDGITAAQYQHLMVKMDEYAGELFVAVLPNVLTEFVQNYLVIAALGFVRSIAVDRSFLPLYAVGMYILACVLVLLLLRKDKHSKSAWFMLLTLLLICGTVFGTSIAIECISRYMIYNFPFFYIAGMAMIKEVWDNKKGLKKNGI